MADKLEFSEKLVYDYFKQHKLPKSEAEAVIQMVQFARSEETEPSEALKEIVNRYLYDNIPIMRRRAKAWLKADTGILPELSSSAAISVLPAR